MDAVAPGFIAAGGHYATATHAPDDEGFTLQAAVAEAFDRDEEGIQIQVEYCPIVHGRNIRLLIDYLLVINIEIRMPDARLADIRLMIFKVLEKIFDFHGRFTILNDLRLASASLASGIPKG
jgi:hypothetical protein